jgi:hypothetical protein
MAVHRKPRRRETQLAFEALSIEGGLLSADWLGRAAQLQAGSQSEADYRVPKGLNLRDEIGRYWRIAQALWSEFSTGRQAGADPLLLAERFVQGLLRDVFGFASLAATPLIEIAERPYPIGFSALGGRVPVVIAPAPVASSESEIDTALQAFGDAGRKRSAFGLAQEYLNTSDDAVWGIASDGVVLRILRDNASLTRPAWIEADLGRIFTEERYADFAALWLLSHESRFGSTDRPATECALEAWRTAGREEGTRAREHLRRGVEDAVVAFGHGFLSHPDNQALRAALKDGSLTTTGYFQELLRFVYRLIFLLTAEERGVLHGPDATDQGKALYAEGYGLRRLRDRSARRSAHDRFSDLWESLKIVLRGIARGEERLGLPALGGLFDHDQCPSLDAAKLENRALLYGVFRLSWLREDGSLARVNWRDMGPEELGSVYESLLELVPQITQEGRAFGFATGGETKGNARKTTGSYYTPDSLVQLLLDSALEPVVQSTIAANPEHGTEALLQLSIVDPACGSGHFLLAAARRLAAHVARLRANGTPSAADYRHALRQVVGRCIFGVDLNPMAVELCKVSLWMEAVEPGRPLSFLDAHIQRGNSLLGATPELLATGIPDAAWEPIEGDDKRIASALKKQNKKERTELTLDFGAAPASSYARLGAGALAVDDAADENLAAVESKERQWFELVASTAYERARFIADLWCAAFVWQKDTGALRDIAPTQANFRAIQQDTTRAPLGLREEIDRLSEQYGFFHWHLAFPQILARGGFDVVLGNPPWERVKLEEQEFFASRSEEIAIAPNAAARKRLIAKLPDVAPRLWTEWCAASRKAEGESHFIRQSKRYPLCGKGDVNTYSVFAEHNRAALGPAGRAGFIVPTGIATDDTTKEFFQTLIDGAHLRALYDFQSGPGLFGSIGHGTFKFALVTVSAAGGSAPAQFSFSSRTAAEARAPERVFLLSPSDIALINPNTRTCPTFRSARDAQIALGLFRRAGVFWNEAAANGNPWGARFMRMIDMTNDAELFHSRADLEARGFRLAGTRFDGPAQSFLPLLEAKMHFHFDHRFGDYRDHPEGSENLSLPDVPQDRLTDADYSPMGRYWVEASECASRLAEFGAGAPRWLFGWRDVSKTQNERTVVASLTPYAAVANNFPLLFTQTRPDEVVSLYANFCSFALDYAARQKLGGTHLNYFVLKQLPLLTPDIYEKGPGWASTGTIREWLLPRVLELTYTAWDLEPFAHDVGHKGPPFRWDLERRSLLRAELDAAFFHLYGLSRDDVGYVMDTFPIVRKNDEKAHGEYRTKRLILEVYDAMTEATRTGEPYVTRLDPPPADPRVAHPPKSKQSGRGNGKG